MTSPVPKPLKPLQSKPYEIKEPAIAAVPKPVALKTSPPPRRATGGLLSTAGGTPAKPNFGGGPAITLQPTGPAATQPEDPEAWRKDPNARGPAGTIGSNSGARMSSPAATWNPATGLMEAVVGAETEDVGATTYEAGEVGPAQEATATGYDATTYDPTLAPDAVGYTAEGYDAETYEAVQSEENLSGAIERITDRGGDLMARAENEGRASAARRGLLASSMAEGAARGAVLDRASDIGKGDVQNSQFNAAQQNDALRFSADARNNASAFMANAKNVAAQFIAAEQNQNGRFNAQQANDAARFTAEAKNQASQFKANAENLASTFNAGEANRLSMFAVEQSNIAARFAAEAENAAAQFNAAAFNKANQAYTDAMNSALAAMFDAENMSRRDAANAMNAMSMQATESQSRAEVAGIGAHAQIQSANIHANASAAEGAANRAFQAAENTANRIHNSSESGADREERRRQFNATLQYNNSTLGQNAFGQFSQGIDNINNNANLTPEQRTAAIRSWIQTWTGNPYLPIDPRNLGVG